jgi:hypothetical protein
VPLEPLTIRVEVLSYREHSPLPARTVNAVQTDAKGEPILLGWDGTAFQPSPAGGAAKP